MGTAQPCCQSRVPATVEERTTPRGPKGSQAGEKAGTDPALSTLQFVVHSEGKAPILVGEQNWGRAGYADPLEQAV